MENTSPLHKNNIPSVLFVCTANLIRSPIAGALFRFKLRQTLPDWRNWRIESAGTWARPDLPVLPEAEKVAEDHGLNIAGHLSRQVTAKILSEFQLILTMELGQKEALQVEFPKYAKNVYALSEMAGESSTIEDPVGGTPSDYEQTFIDIDYWLEMGWDRILKLAQGEK